MGKFNPLYSGEACGGLQVVSIFSVLSQDHLQREEIGSRKVRGGGFHRTF